MGKRFLVFMTMRILGEGVEHRGNRLTVLKLRLPRIRVGTLGCTGSG